MNRAMTLIELLISLAILFFLAGIAVPIFSLHHRTHFHHAALRWSAILHTAEIASIQTRERVSLRFETKGDDLYIVTLETDTGLKILARETRSKYFQLKLPADGEILHPHTGKPMTDAFSGPPSKTFTFSPTGFSSGTLLFSDGQGNLVCTVLSGSNKRVLHYRKRLTDPEWLAL